MDRHERLEELVRALPQQPGVYIMKDADGTIIYVGKAISLRNRVSSYFGSLTGQTGKVAAMVSHIADFEYIITDTEQEALNLENALIKRNRPKYNILLKDDKTYPYIKMTVNEEWPRVFVVRKVVPDGARYFGPYATTHSVYPVVALLNKLFPYRSCDLTITGKEARPCLEYHIHHCLGPCAGLADKADYDEAIRQVSLYLEGKSDEVENRLTLKMETAADNLDFERAAVIRDQLKSVREVIERQKIVSSDRSDSDALAVVREENEACVQTFFVRQGKVSGRESFFMQGVADESEADILTSFVKQFYAEATYIPPTIYLQHGLADADAIQEWLTASAGALQGGGTTPELSSGAALAAEGAARVGQSVPQADDQPTETSGVRLVVPTADDPKHDLIELVARNALEAMQQNRLRWLNDAQKTIGATVELQRYLELPNRPNRIECYDISNTQGTNSVASMVVFENGSPKKSDYRKFKIKTVEGPNDFDSMREVIRRRFMRAKTVEEMDAVAEDENAVSVEEEIAALESVADDPAGAEAVVDDAAADVPDPYRAGGSLRAMQAGKAAEIVAQKRAGTAEAADGTEKTKAKDFSWQNIPDLVIIDGGKGQLHAAYDVLRELGLDDIPIVGLAKQNEELFKPNNPLSVYLPRTSEALYLVQRVRDEAHRFAITFHRQLRSKAATKSKLEDVPGIGPKRRVALLKRFGSLDGIRKASDADVLSVEGMNKAALAKLREFV